MRKRLVTGLLTGGLLLGMLPATASAADAKVNFHVGFQSVSCGGFISNPGPSGRSFVQVKFLESRVEVHIVLKDLAPNTTYAVAVGGGLFDCLDIDTTVTTNRNGSATLRYGEAFADTGVLVGLFGLPSLITPRIPAVG